MVSIVRCLDWYRGWDSELELAVGAGSWLSCYFYFVGAPCGRVCEGVLCGPWIFVVGISFARARTKSGSIKNDRRFLIFEKGWVNVY